MRRLGNADRFLRERVLILERGVQLWRFKKYLRNLLGGLEMADIWFDSDKDFAEWVTENIWGISQPVNASAQQSVSSDGGRAIMSWRVGVDLANQFEKVLQKRYPKGDFFLVAVTFSDEGRVCSASYSGRNINTGKSQTYSFKLSDVEGILKVVED